MPGSLVSGQILAVLNRGPAWNSVAAARDWSGMKDSMAIADLVGLLWSLYLCFSLETKEKRFGPVPHVVLFRAGETMSENGSVIQRIPETSEEWRWITEELILR